MRALAMRLLVTGMAGFIGSHLSERLLTSGHELTGLDNFDAFYGRAVKERNLASVLARGLTTFVEGDILDRDLVQRLFARGRFDGVVHLAALAGVSPSVGDPARYMRVNVEGTMALAEAMIRHGVHHMVFASSSSVYGANTKVPFHEDDRIDDPVSPYAASKRAGELALKALVHTHGISVAALRFFTVYGPRQRPDMAIHKFTRAIDAGEPVRVRGSGTTSRDYTYVDDIIDGTAAAVERVATNPSGFRPYNLGGSRGTELNDLVARIGVAVGKEPKIERIPGLRGDVEHTLANVARAEAELGFAPRISLDEGLRRFVAWYRA